jgi:peptidoglycan hydrolase-like protein with peptidoglycan-binding domain
MLNNLGFSAGTPDGIFGNRTRGAIEGFLAAHYPNVQPGLTLEVVALVRQVHGPIGNAAPAPANPAAAAAARAAAEAAAGAVINIIRDGFR